MTVVAPSDMREFTTDQVASHTTKENQLYLIIDEKVYDCTKFLDEHPGGEEVITDVAGQDATEAFEDVGHSDEARETLETLKIGIVKRKRERQPGEDVPKRAPAYQSPSGSSTGGSGLFTYFILMLALGAGYFYYQSLQEKPQVEPATA